MTQTTIFGGQVGSETLRAGEAITITVVVGSGCVMERFLSGQRVQTLHISSTTTLGPYAADQVFRVSAYTGSTVVLDTSAIPTDLESSVSGDGQSLQAAYVDFTGAANGAPPAALDSGQVVDYVIDTTGRRPIVTNGRLVVENQAAAGSGGLADYYQSDLGGPIHRIGAEWTLPAGSDTGQGAMCYAAWGPNIYTALTPPPATWAHVVVLAGTGSTGTCNWWVGDGTNLRQIKSQTFVNPAADGVTRWRCESVLDATNGIGYTYLPDGTVMTLTDAEVAANFVAAALAAPTLAALAAQSRVMMIEHFAVSGAASAKFPEFTGVWADTAAAMPSVRTAAYQAVLDTARADAALRRNIEPPPSVVVYAPTTALVVATTTSAASVDATNVTLSATAGVLGAIVFEVAAWYDWTATDVMFWRMNCGAGGATTVRAAWRGVSGSGGVIKQTITISGLTPGQSYSCRLEHWSVLAGSATLRAGGSGGSMYPPVTILAIPR